MRVFADSLVPCHYKASCTIHLTLLCAVGVESKGKGKVTAEEELRASKGKGKMAEPVDVDDDEEDEEDFDEDVSAFPAQCILQSVVSTSHLPPVSDQTIAAWLHVHESQTACAPHTDTSLYC